MSTITPARVLTECVIPAIDALTEPGEITSIRVSEASKDEGWPEPGALVVELVFAGETCTIYLLPSDGDRLDAMNGRGKVASDLQDFIAESAYAWGTLRTYPDEWGT